MTARRILVIGLDAGTVGRTVSTITESGDAVAAGYVGTDEITAREMAREMLGGLDEVVRAPRSDQGAGEGGQGAPERLGGAGRD